MKAIPLALRASAGALVLVILAGLLLLGGGTPQRQLTALFPSAVGLYPKATVRVLGVVIGHVDTVTPQGRTVKVTMTYRSNVSIPANAQAFIIPPSVISDRYVQLTPPYTGGPTLPNHAVLPESRSHSPVEIDQILASLHTMAQALGPTGANKNGALSRLIAVSAANLQGNGAQIHTTIKDFSQAVQTLGNNSGVLVQVIDNLGQFTHLLAVDNQQVLALNADLAGAFADLDADRANLAAAMKNLSVALGEVAGFVQQNKANLTANVTGLTQVTGAIMSQKQALVEFLDDAPLALQNLNLANPTGSILNTKADNPQSPGSPYFQTFLCQLIINATKNPNACASVAGLLPPGTPTLPLSGAVK